MAGMFSKHSDSFYYEVACRADEIIFEKTVGEMPTRDELKRMYSFSPEFESKMKVLLNRIDQRRIVPTSVKRILIIAAIVAALIVGALTANAIYNVVYNLYLSCMGNYSIAAYSENSDLSAEESKSIEAHYEPSVMIEGYEEAYRHELGLETKISYKNSDSEIFFTQNNIAAFKLLDNEDIAAIYISIGDWTAQYISKDNHLTLIWEEYGYFFSLEGYITLDDAVLIAQSLKEVQ